MVDYRKKLTLRIIFENIKEKDIESIKDKAKTTFKKAKIKSKITKTRWPPVVHWSVNPCGRFTDKSKSTENKDKVTCCNCFSRIHDVEKGFTIICDCGNVLEKQYHNKSNFCSKCGKSLV